MKIQKLFMIEKDIVERLQSVSNMSALVNSLLERHFNILEDDISTKQLDERKTHLEAQLKVIEDKQAEIKANFDKKEEIESKIKEQEDLEWERSKAETARKAQLRKQYEAETPTNLRNASGFEEFCKLTQASVKDSS